MSINYADLFRHMEAGTLHTCDFSHEAHIGVAYQALETYPFFDALAAFAKGIETAAAASGAADKFNATVTLAFMIVIAERRAKGQYKDAADFVARNPDLSAKGLLARWYTPNLLGCDLARSVALMPDRVVEIA
ncbi:MAG: hypothetical protein AAF557_20720 [Pseudomonadota bacterium]